MRKKKIWKEKRSPEKQHKINIDDYLNESEKTMRESLDKTFDGESKQSVNKLSQSEKKSMSRV